MPSTYTPSLRLTLQATGENSGTWGNLVNTGVTGLIDTSIAGTASITMTGADYTLTESNGGVDESRAMILSLGGSPGGSYNVICPAVSKLYIVVNGTGHAQTLKTSAGTGISVPNGSTAFLRCNGTNVVSAVDYFANSTVFSGVFLDGYTEEVNTANTGAAYTINLSDGTVQILTLTDNCTLTFPTAVAGKSFILLIKQDGTGGRTVTWPAVAKWPSNAAPAVITTANQLDKFVFTSDGTNWYGSNGGQNYTV